MAGHLQQLHPSKQLLLGHKDYDHDQEVDPEWCPEPQACEAQSDKAGPVH